MESWQDIYEEIINDPRYTEGVSYGKPRAGHAEGTVKAHIFDLDRNLDRMRCWMADSEYWRLRVLIHVHDTFKYRAKRDSAIEDPQSHASLARQFLSEFTTNEDMLNMVQYHDEGFALWKQQELRGHYNHVRFINLINAITDIELFLLFTIIDGYTPSKQPDKIRWFIEEVRKACPDKCPVAGRLEVIMREFGI